MNSVARTLVAVGLFLLVIVGPGRSQEPYRTPPPDVVAIVDAPPPPSVEVSPDGEWMTLLDRRAYPSIAQLADPAIGLAGVRFNPRTSGDDQPPLGSGLRLIRLADAREWTIELPAAVQLTSPFWAPDGEHFAFTSTTADGVELWVVAVDSRRARRLTGPELVAVTGTACSWLPDSEGVICELIPSDRAAVPERPRVPVGPTIQEASGRRAPVRTYQNLLKSPFDQQLFDHYFTAQLTLIELDGDRSAIGSPGIFRGWSVSPDGKSLLVSRIERPYSYLVPFSRFPHEVEVWNMKGEILASIASLRLADGVPIGGVAEGPRSIRWLPGQDGALVWTEALDGGDPKAEVEHRDRLMMLASPYSGEAAEFARTELRAYQVRWSPDGSFALARTWDRPTRATKTVIVQPARPGETRVIWDRSSEDAYGDPGNPVMGIDRAGQFVLRMGSEAKTIFLTGRGASPEGDHPFIDSYDVATGVSQRLWQAEDPYYESVVELLDQEGLKLLTRRESKREPPNYFVRHLRADSETALTHYQDPAPQLTGIEKKRIKYTRADGVELSGTLYLPPGYEEDRPLPAVVWAYPREFRSASAGSQVRGSENRFTFFRGYSHLFFLTQGYIVLDNASMPVVGEGDAKPNDSFVEQLVMNAQAAVDELVALGVTDRHKVGIGGHSYGAFMTANLLVHSDIFRAGIARSGAYNRSLTPFGFQNERRTFWEAPEVYFAMSPFMHAEEINEPLLMLHGEEDTNSGTFPIQSQRMFHAVKGLGGTVKLVMYPDEKHGYRARETVLDALYQQFQWFDRWVKNAAPHQDETVSEEAVSESG